MDVAGEKAPVMVHCMGGPEYVAEDCTVVVSDERRGGTSGWRSF